MSQADDRVGVTLRNVASRLERRFDGRFGAGEIEQQLLDAYAQLAADARIGTHLLTLAERVVRERLVEQAKAPLPSS